MSEFVELLGPDDWLSISGILTLLVGAWFVSIEVVIRFKGHAYRVDFSTENHPEKTEEFSKWELKHAKFMMLGLLLITVGSLLQLFSVLWDHVILHFCT